MSNCEMMENNNKSLPWNDTNREINEKENGAGAMPINDHVDFSPPPADGYENIGEDYKIILNKSEATKDGTLHMTPPPPPPSTPVQLNRIAKRSVDVNILNAQLVSEISDEVLEEPCKAILPPPMPKKEAEVVFCNKNFENLSFKALLERAKLNLKSIKINEKEKSYVSKVNTYISCFNNIH